MADDRPMLALIREDADIEQLPEDPRWFIAAPANIVGALAAVLGVAATTVLFVFLFITRRHTMPAGVDLAVGAFVVVVLGLMWAAAIHTLVARRTRGAFFREYARVVASRPQPRHGTITRSDVRLSDSGTIERCTAGVAVDGGGMLEVRRHPSYALHDGDGGDIRRSSHHAPQHGDAVTIFEDPQGVLPLLVLTNRRARA